MNTDLPLHVDALLAAIHQGDDRAALIDTPGVFAGVKTYQPGEIFANHYHVGYDEFFAVLDGTITVWTGRRTKTVLCEGTTLLCPRGLQHYLANETDVPARLFYAKVPMVADDSVRVDWSPEAGAA